MEDCRQNYEGNEVNIQLNGIQSRHVHLYEPILPINSGDPAVMDASWDVTKPFTIFPKAVILVIQVKWAQGCKLQVIKALLAATIVTQLLQVLHVTWPGHVMSEEYWLFDWVIFNKNEYCIFGILWNKAVDGNCYVSKQSWDKEGCLELQ